MFNLHVVQAEFGDCFILEYGLPASPRFILVDGGPGGIFNAHLRPVLADIAAADGRLNLAILSHADGDHIVGLIDLLTDTRVRHENGASPLIEIDALWHNSFSRTVDPNGTITPRMNALFALAGANSTVMSTTGVAVQSINQGNQLRRLALLTDIPLNPGFTDDLIIADTATEPRLFDNLSLTVVGPTQHNLDRLEREWLEWLDEHEGDDLADPFVAAKVDRSITNLSSIVLLAEADGRSLLLTGDARGDHIIQGLEQKGLFDGDGRFHVDVLKLPHHGSVRNISRDFFRRVTADTYVISANGLHDNPDLAALIWLVESARDDGRAIDIFATNATTATEAIVRENPPADFGYTLTIAPGPDHVFPLTLAP